MTIKSHRTSICLNTLIDFGVCCGDEVCVGGTQMTPGFGAGQADRHYSQKINIPASGTINIDLAALVDDESGAIKSMAKVKELFIRNLANPIHPTSIVQVASGTFDAVWGGAVGQNDIGPANDFYIADTTNGYAVGGGVFTIENLSADRAVNVLVCITGTSV